VQRAIELAARQGVNQARIELSPASLGTVRIHLQRTDDGVVARVVAGHEAAQSFHQNSDDLRRALQSHGVNLLRLHIETSGRGNAQNTAAQHGTPGHQHRASTEGPGDHTPDSGPVTTNLNPAGLIDVLA
jgi:flagellar hook-length control protein FliK